MSKREPRAIPDEVIEEVVYVPTFAGDDTATWTYWVGHDPVDVPDEWVWERLRNRRNALIAESDFRVVADAPWDTAPWIAYRTELRVLPENTVDPRIAVWPTSP